MKEIIVRGRDLKPGQKCICLEHNYYYNNMVITVKEVKEGNVYPVEESAKKSFSTVTPHIYDFKKFKLIVEDVKSVIDEMKL